MSDQVGDRPRVVVAVVGCGAMGAGIAQVALLAGHRVVLRDLDQALAEQARDAVLTQVDRQVAKGRLDAGRVPELRARLEVASDVGDVGPAGLVIEAVAESPHVKRAVLAELEAVVGPECVLATNTSSLSLDDLAVDLHHPGRFVGMHFFNPPAVMRLVEVVRGAATSDDVVDLVASLAVAWGKTAVVVRDSPGFVVNRVARAYYSESLRLLDDGLVDPATLDRLLRAAGFPMGPCELMDLIGHDISLAATTSVWEATGRSARYAPSETQRRLVTADRLGRKTGRGFFVHPAPPPVEPAPAAGFEAGEVVSVAGHGSLALAVSAACGTSPGSGPVDEVVLSSGARVRTTDGRPAAQHVAETGDCVLLVDRFTPGPGPVAVAVGVPDGCPAPVVDEALRVLRSCGLDPVPLADVPGLVVSRVVSLLVDEASEVVGRGVASALDVDTALRLGAGHPRGPLAWGDAWGPGDVVTVLDHLLDASGDERYRAGDRLRRHASTRRPLTEP